LYNSFKRVSRGTHAMTLIYKTPAARRKSHFSAVANRILRRHPSCLVVAEVVDRKVLFASGRLLQLRGLQSSGRFQAHGPRNGREFRGRGREFAMRPVVDGRVIPHLPFEPGAPDLAADVPTMIGTTETEGTYNAADVVGDGRRGHAPATAGADFSRLGSGPHHRALPEESTACDASGDLFHHHRNAACRDQTGRAKGRPGKRGNGRNRP
jgi:hypothetical protein